MRDIKPFRLSKKAKIDTILMRNLRQKNKHK
ncbi:hypothetical protein LCGC14_0899930 [marine sediment metagenome]|uniref:Uncharacterized protein n=1 Tax=marine sediment metagenome TaxID=412755 RepID=A0A0F9S3M0_9ZZZZ